MWRFLRFVPKNHASYFLGKLVHLELPGPLARRTIRWFARAFDIDTEISARPMSDYASIGAFFTRDLKEGSRPIRGNFVSPVDGTMRNFGAVENGVLEQVKGKTYSLRTFLGDDELASTFEGGTYFNFYLSPQDYHHVHSPVSGTVIRSIHVPGRLWPVNDWSMRNIESLFAVNERVITFLECSLGLVAVVMVGATNVGKMSVTYDAFVTNTTFATRKIETHLYDPAPDLEVGDRLGTFHMGSSVVVLLQKDAVAVGQIIGSAPRKVVFGEPIVDVDT